MATKGTDIYDVPDAGQGGDFALCYAGGGLYFATIAKGGDGGRLFVGPVGGQPATINLGPLGITGALSVRLDGHGPGGTLVAYISRIIDTDGQDRGRRVITPVETGIAVGGGGDTPVTPPAPPGASIDLSTVLQAIAAARGPLNGKDAETNTIAGVHNGVDAVYDRLGREAGGLITDIEAVGGVAREAADATWLFRKPTRDYGLPEGLAKYLDTELGQFLAAWLTAYLEYVLRLGEFPRADGGTILRT